MSSSDYRAWVEVLPEFSQFNQTVQNGVVGGLAGAGASGSAAMGGTLVAGVGKFAGPLIAAFAAIGIADFLTGQITKGIDAGINYLKGAVAGAADLEQSVGAVNSVFGGSADQVLSWGGEAANAVGLSRNSFLEYSTVVGAQLKNLGIPMSDVAGQTNELIGLGADLSAMFGGTTADAVSALSSLLRGERDPIERYGVSIKQADINARLAAMGLSDLTGEERRQAEILATLAILNDQTADAQGTFADESETFLGVQQRMQAQLEDTAAELGEQLLPVITDVMVFIKDELLPAWKDLNEELGPVMREALDDLWPILKDLAELILPLIPIAIDYVIRAFEYFFGAAKIIITWVDLVASTFGDLFAFLKGDMSFEEFVANFQERLGDWFGAVSDQVGRLLSVFVDFGVGVATTVLEIGANLYRSGRAMIQQFIDGIRSMLKPLSDVMNNVMNFVGGFFPSSPAERGPFSGSGWSRILQSGAAIMDAFEAGLRPVDVPLTASLTALPAPRLQSTESMVAPDGTPMGRDPGPIKLDDESIQKLAEAIFTRGRLESRMGVA